MKINYQYQTQKRIYELTDHLGNVRAVIKREKDANNRAQIIKASDYYPFGMEMPGRKYSSEAYRYDYQGQFAEKDGETGLHSFEARLWDARIARWTSMDPVENFFSPYAGMHNNPISQVDPDGRFPLIAIAIGALTNAVIQNYKGNINNFGDFVSAMAIGAVKGAGSYAVGQFVGGIVGSNSLSLADEGVGVFASSDPTLLDEIVLTASRGGGFDFSNTVSTLLSFGGHVYGGFGTPDFNMNLYPNSTLLPTVDVYAYQNGGKTIIYQRTTETDLSTIGTFSISGTDINGYFIEPAGPSTTTPNLDRRIPAGTYSLQWHNGNNYQGVLKLSNSQVPVSRAILIHKGNYPSNTSGCLLPGCSTSTDVVWKSETKLSLINNHFNNVGTNGATMIIRDPIYP